jgi:DNA-binding NarL/FixJ family response regulator
MQNPASNKREIILADNQALTACGIKYLLGQNHENAIVEVKERANLIELVSEKTALIIVDYLFVKDFDVMDMAELKKLNPDVPTLVVTSDQNRATILEVLETGVNGFLFKDCYEDEIRSAVEATIAGKKFYGNKVFEILMEARQQKAVNDCLPAELTEREIDIIKLVVTGRSSLAIAEKLHLSPHTISTHRKNILKKLKIKSPVELVTYAYDWGLIKPVKF